MNRRLLLLSALLFSVLSLHAVSANIDVTNTAILTHDFSAVTNSAVVTVAGYYGLGAMTSASNLYNSPPNFTYRIAAVITNNANDADSNTVLSVSFLSNNSGYSGSNWSAALEVGGSNVGTNYAIPFTSFGEGAVFSFNILVTLPPVCPIGSSGFLTVEGSTASNATHPTAVYTGINGINYGGASNTSKNLRVDAYMPYTLSSLSASDGIDTIAVFNGSAGLRRSRNTVDVGFTAAPADPNSVYLWYDIDTAADGPGGANASDVSVRMQPLTARTFRASIPESDLLTGSFVSFVFEADGIAFISNFTYTLLSLSGQAGYETVLMNNMIDPHSGDQIFIKMPARLLGQSGRVTVYSISGDNVRTIHSGMLENQILAWEGKDRVGEQAASGMYFIVVDFADLKEVRKVFIR